MHSYFFKKEVSLWTDIPVDYGYVICARGGLRAFSFFRPSPKDGLQKYIGLADGTKPPVPFCILQCLEMGGFFYA